MGNKQFKVQALIVQVLYIYIYRYIHTYIHTDTYIYTYTDTYIDIYIYIYIYIVVGQLDQNENNMKIKRYDLGVSTYAWLEVSTKWGNH